MAKAYVKALFAAFALMASVPVLAQAPPPLRPDAQAYLDAMKANPRPPMNDMVISFIRQIPDEQIVQMLGRAELPVGPLAVDRKMVVPGPAGDIPVRFMDSKADRAAGPALVFYHGGGFVLGSSATHAPLAAELSRQLDMPVVSVDYRLAPEAKWPAAMDDGEAAARWIAANGAAFGREFNGLVLAGDSAGGTLTLTTALALRDRAAAVPVKLMIPLYPMADGSRPYGSMTAFSSGYGLDAPDMAYFTSAFAGDVNSPRYSALLADLHGLPPTVLATASHDPLRDSGRAFAQKLVEAGVPVSYYEAHGTIHGFTTFRKAIPSAQNDLARIINMAKAMLAVE